MIVPASGKVLIKKKKFSLKSDGGIYYPDTSWDGKKRTIIGDVIEIGEGVNDVSPGDVVVFDPQAGFELIGSDHFDLSDDGVPRVGFNALSDERDYAIIDSDFIVAKVEDYDGQKIY